MYHAMHLSFNRTFMELKLGNKESGMYRSLCFNRTFMELKLSYTMFCLILMTVLIGPSWN